MFVTIVRPDRSHRLTETKSKTKNHVKESHATTSMQGSMVRSNQLEFPSFPRVWKGLSGAQPRAQRTTDALHPGRSACISRPSDAPAAANRRLMCFCRTTQISKFPRLHLKWLLLILRTVLRDETQCYFGLKIQAALMRVPPLVM